MYGSISNQAYHLFHFCLGFIVAYLLVPRAVMNPVSGKRTDISMSYFLRMVFFVICVGYLLLIIKLYEVIGLAGVLLVSALIRHARRRDPRNRITSTTMALFYDVVEARYVIANWVRRLISRLRSQYDSARRLRVKWSPSTIEVCLAAWVMAASAFVRVHDAITEPAPALSDGYTTLAWLKYVDERVFFHDGIYPQGFYFYMSLIDKLARINLLYILKYSGPLSTVLIVFGLYYVVSRMSDDRAAGLYAAISYGVLGPFLLHGDWMRQAATNSQEFGFVFVLPTIYFLLRFMETGDVIDFQTAFSGLCITGLTHPLAYGLNVMGCSAVLIAASAIPVKQWRSRFLRCLLGGGISGLITLAPIVAGRLLGRNFNSSSADFATSHTANVTPPALYPFDWIALMSLGLLTVAALWQVIRSTHRAHHPRRYVLFSAVFGWFVFGLYYLGGPITDSTVIIARALDLWAIVEPILVAVAIHQVLNWARKPTWTRWINCAILTLLMSWTSIEGVISPINPYKMQWNAGVQAYLDIDAAHRYQGYMLVAPNEEYTLVLGDAFRMDVADFVNRYDPTLPPLTMRGQHHLDENIAPNVFIYYFKQIFEVSRTNAIYSIEAPIYAKRKQDNARLAEWIQEYRQAHGGIRIYYQDSHLVVYQVTAKQSTNVLLGTG